MYTVYVQYIRGWGYGPVDQQGPQGNQFTNRSIPSSRHKFCRAGYGTDEALPSIRSLAKDLRISVITTKRAYDELEAEGPALYGGRAKGCFVARINRKQLLQGNLKQLDALMARTITLGGYVRHPPCTITASLFGDDRGGRRNEQRIGTAPREQTLRARFALQDLSLELPMGCILGLVRRKRRRKINHHSAADEYHPTRQRRNYCAGQKTTRVPGFEAVKEDIGVVLDEAYFPEVITAKQLNVVMKHTYCRWEENTFFSYLKRFDLPTDKSVVLRDLSRGG